MFDIGSVFLIVVVTALMTFAVTFKLMTMNFERRRRPYVSMVAALVSKGFHPESESVAFWAEIAKGFEIALDSMPKIPAHWNEGEVRVEKVIRERYRSYLWHMQRHVRGLQRQELLAKGHNLYCEMVSGTLSPSRLIEKKKELIDLIHAGQFSFSDFHSGPERLDEFFDGCVAGYTARQLTRSESAE
jgi:hypothetical protein